MAQTNDAGGNELNKVHFKSRSLVEVRLLVDILQALVGKVTLWSSMCSLSVSVLRD